MPAFLASSFGPGFYVGLTAFIVVLVLALFLLARLHRPGGLIGGSSARRLKVLERMPVTRESSVVLLQVGSRVLAVCLGRDGGNVLCEMPLSEYAPPAPAPSDTSAPAPAPAPAAPGFLARFWHNLRLNIGLLPKGTKPLLPGAPRTQAAPPEPSAPGEHATPAEKASFAAMLEKLNAAESGDAQQPAPDYRAALDSIKRHSAGVAQDSSSDAELDELLDKITRRQSRYRARGGEQRHD